MDDNALVRAATLVLAAWTLALTPTPTAAQSVPQFRGTVSESGWSLVAFSGTISELTAAASVARVTQVATSVCPLAVLVTGAPDFVNADFVARFPRGLENSLLWVSRSNSLTDKPPLVCAGGIQGSLQTPGTSNVTWSGGTVDAFVSAARAQSCGAVEISTRYNGRPIVHTVGAPPFVNADWTAAYGATVPASQSVTVICAKVSPPPPPPAAFPLPPPPPPVSSRNPKETPPYTAYGTGQRAGSRIAAYISGKPCSWDTTWDAADYSTATAQGTWKISIGIAAACAPKEGDTVSFTVDERPAVETVRWTAGGAPADAAKGLLLTTTVQGSAPYTAYGVGQRAGIRIAATIDTRACGDTTVDAQGNWKITIGTTAPCSPREGDIISFTLDGVAAAQTVTWSDGGAPSDAARGIFLTVGEEFVGVIAPRGVSFVLFTGTAEALGSAARAKGIVSVVAAQDGRLYAFVVSAPTFVNSEFLGRFVRGFQNQPVLVTK